LRRYTKAFQTPEILKMFALQQPVQLRDRLQVIQRDHKLAGPVTTPYFLPYF